MDKICTIMFLCFTFHGKLLSASASWYNFYCFMSLFDFRYMISVSPLVSSIWRAMPASQDLRRLNGITGNLNVSVLQLSFLLSKISSNESCNHSYIWIFSYIFLFCSAISTFHAMFIATMSLYFVFWSDLYSDSQLTSLITLRHSMLSTFSLGVSFLISLLANIIYSTSFETIVVQNVWLFKQLFSRTLLIQFLCYGFAVFLTRLYSINHANFMTEMKHYFE